MERIIQLLDELDEMVVFLRYAADACLHRLVARPGFLACAVAGTLLPV